MRGSLIRIANDLIGTGAPVFVIAEAGVNHNGDISLAKKMIEIAADAGANCVKFQTFTADTLVTANAAKARYQLETTAANESQLEMLRGLELSAQDHSVLKAHCELQRISFLSTPFDEAAVDLLDELGVEAFKISSGDLTNLPLLAHVARKGKPLIISTGMADMSDVGEAVRVINEAGVEDLILLHCVSNYPAQPADVNLRAMSTLQSAFDVPVGLSDHTEGIDIALAAVALGAVVIEKHFTIDRTLPGPDHGASLDPEDLRSLIRSIRRVEAALGDGIKSRRPSEEDTARVARRSVVAARDISRGTKITSAEIAFKRPGTGLPPKMADRVLGKTARVDIAAGTLLTMDMFD